MNTRFVAMTALAVAVLYGSGAVGQTTAQPSSDLGNTPSAAAEPSISPPADALPADPGATPAEPVSDAKLNQFADAYVAIVAIQTEANSERSAPQDADATKAKEVALQSKMQNAIEKSGLQVEEFNQIAQRSVTDLDLRAKLAEKVQERNGNRGG